MLISQENEIFFISWWYFYLLAYRVTVMKDKLTRKSRGVAFILFLTPEDAITCAKNLNNTEVNWSLLHIIFFTISYYKSSFNR